MYNYKKWKMLRRKFKVCNKVSDFAQKSGTFLWGNNVYSLAFLINLKYDWPNTSLKIIILRLTLSFSVSDSLQNDYSEHTAHKETKKIVFWQTIFLDIFLLNSDETTKINFGTSTSSKSHKMGISASLILDH